jgi:hypothetical protein
VVTLKADDVGTILTLSVRGYKYKRKYEFFVYLNNNISLEATLTTIKLEIYSTSSMFSFCTTHSNK